MAAVAPRRSLLRLQLVTSPIQQGEVRQQRHCECKGVKLQTARFTDADVKCTDETPASLTPHGRLQSALFFVNTKQTSTAIKTDKRGHRHVCELYCLLPSSAVLCCHRSFIMTHHNVHRDFSGGVFSSFSGRQIYPSRAVGVLEPIPADIG